MKYVCTICGYVYDEAAEKTPFAALPEAWKCPVCGAPKSVFEARGDDGVPAVKSSAPATEAAKGGMPSAASQSVGQALVDTFAARGVRCVFGMVGHSNLGVADAVRACVERGAMRFVGVRHEGAAAFAASAYGKLTGRPAACLTIAGPGATNLITGLCDAALDRAPVIALTGQIPAPAMGRYIFQELDLHALFKPFACAQLTPSAGVDVRVQAAYAYDRAVGEGGVAQLILPDDVQTQTAPASRVPAVPPRLAPACLPLAAIEAALARIRAASNPVIVAGEGARDAAPELRAFAERLNAPVATTYRAKGLLPDDFPLACGVVGRSGTPMSAAAVAQADLLIAVGIGFSNHTGLPKDKAVLQIDRDARAFGRLHTVDVALVGDAAATLERLTQAWGASPRVSDAAAQIASGWAAWRAEKTARARKSVKGALDPAFVCAALTAAIPANAVVSIDVGNVAYQFGRYFESRGQRCLLSWYLGSIGVGLPAAIGAACAAREAGAFQNCPVWAIVGDGGLGQYLADWTTCVKDGLPVKCVVFNNGELAKISLEQRNAKFPVWQTGLRNPSFAEYARLCGAFGVRVETPEALAGALAAAAAHDGAALVDVAVG